MQFAHAGTPARKKSKWWQSDALKWLVVGLFSTVTCYLIVLMYAQGEYLFAILTLIWSAPGFTSSPTAAPMPGAMCIPASPAWRCSSCSR